MIRCRLVVPAVLLALASPALAQEAPPVQAVENHFSLGLKAGVLEFRGYWESPELNAFAAEATVRPLPHLVVGAFANRYFVGGEVEGDLRAGRSTPYLEAQYIYANRDGFTFHTLAGIAGYTWRVRPALELQAGAGIEHNGSPSITSTSAFAWSLDFDLTARWLF